MSTQIKASKKLGYLILNYMLGVDVPEESTFGNMFSKEIAERLDRVQRIRNFRHVMHRLLKQGEPGAWAEVDVASRIKRAGYYVEFSSPKAPETNPDLIVKIRREKVLFEVIYLQRPTGRGKRLSEANRIKRAVDNKVKQLPDYHKGVIVIYDRDVSTSDLSPSLVREVKKKIARYPNVMAVAVVKPLFKRGGTSKIDGKKAYVMSRQVFRGVYSRYTLIVKGEDTDTRVFRSVRDVLCRRF
ncbi:MAG: hypothetical protein NOU37_03265 [Candidatus Brocadiales bacterium]|nr:hypothetical protein [Candidatus Bathyanammoxibius sp.]MCQ4574255.1 hypothetical protein [Candidatus Bathyanammoxibius amoris]